MPPGRSRGGLPVPRRVGRLECDRRCSVRPQSERWCLAFRGDERGTRIASSPDVDLLTSRRASRSRRGYRSAPEVHPLLCLFVVLELQPVQDRVSASARAEETRSITPAVLVLVQPQGYRVPTSLAGTHLSSAAVRLYVRREGSRRTLDEPKNAARRQPMHPSPPAPHQRASERGRADHPVRHAGPALVKADQPTERRKIPECRSERRRPDQLGMR